ncbi:MAG: A/G-specific adenine glycosylase [Phototrophicales bacterium]|nr:MAG: A/G-specific adenine glycosylase [Phototrophicales bacterium]
MTAPFYDDLLAWYDQSVQPLPWRILPQDRAHLVPNPYHVWLSEMMLQQTQIETVIPYYNRFINTYPTIHDLANAPLDEVLKLWEGLGYYSRCRYLHQTAKRISDQNGQFPPTIEGLLALPGIGRYTAGAIASIAFDLPAPVLDGNVIRLFARLTDLGDDVTLPSTKEALWDLASAWMPTQRPGDYNQALMMMGQTVCMPKHPKCDSCPIQRHCRAYANRTQHERPVKPKKSPIPHYDVAAGIIIGDDGRILIAQRPNAGLLGGLWEFPGGKREAGETMPQALIRELHEELGIMVEVGDLFIKVKHAFTHFKITLHAYICKIISGTPQLLGVQNVAWVTPDEFGQYAFGKADRAVIQALLEQKNRLF